MRLITITQENKNASRALIDQYKDLLKKNLNFYTVGTMERSLRQGDTLFLLVDGQDKVIAGAMMEKNSQGLADGYHLASGTCAYSFVYSLVAAADSSLFMPGLELQRKINQEFKNKAGAFSDIHVMTADVVQKNLLLWHEAMQETGLHAVMKTSPVNAMGDESAFFVAAARDRSVNLVPKGQKECFLTNSEDIREKAHTLLLDIKKRHQSRLKKQRGADKPSPGGMGI